MLNQQVTDARIELRTGDTVLIHTPLTLNPTTWLSWTIRQFCKIRYNHCGIIISNHGKLAFNEAVESGVRPIPLGDRLEGLQVIILRDPQRCEFRFEQSKFAVKANGFWGKTPYDYWSLCVVFPIYILTGKWIGRTGPSAAKKQVCSEYIANCYGMDAPWKKSPKDILDYPKFIPVFQGKFTYTNFKHQISIQQPIK
jgi:hypothetical protein